MPTFGKRNRDRYLPPKQGFVLGRGPDTVRAPDVAFISSDRLQSEEIPDSFIEMAPDLVVEVVSPGDSRREVEEKVEDWLQAGVQTGVGHPPIERGLPTSIVLTLTSARFTRAISWRAGTWYQGSPAG